MVDQKIGALALVLVLSLALALVLVLAPTFPPRSS